MADRGFQIQEDLLLHFCNLQVPQTKEIANLRIDFERANNGIKNYRILKGILSITMMQHVDEIVLVCAALCNIKNVLIQTKKD